MSSSANTPRNVLNTEPPDGRRLSIMGHLEELRSGLMVCALAIVAASVVSFAKAGRIIEWLKRPIGNALPTLAVFSPTEALGAYLKVAVMAGCCLSLPVIIYVLWLFIRPGLTRPEQRAALAWLVWGGVLFLVGAAFAYWVLLPMSLAVLLEIGRGTLTPVISLSHYLSFTTTLMLVCGAVFELPVAVFVLTRFGLVSPTFLRRQWRPAVLIMLVVSAILTPTADAATMLLMTAPLLALYGVAVLVSHLAHAKR